MIYTLKSKSKHFNLKRNLILFNNQFEVINCNDWLQQTRLLSLIHVGSVILHLDGEKKKER